MSAWQKGTLDGEGYMYNPFSETDIWGTPAQVNMTPVTHKELPVGADSSAMPLMSEHYLRNGGIITGSDQSKQWQRTNYQQQQRTVDNNYLLLAFAVILGVAFYRGL